MTLENKLGITDSSELAREEERISKKKAVSLFDLSDDRQEAGLLDTFEVGKFAGLSKIHAYLFSDINNSVKLLLISPDLINGIFPS